MTGIPYEIEDDSYYLFNCAELKARENEFVAQSKLERILSAASMEEFLKVLGETIYASRVGTIENQKSFEQVMLSEYGKMAFYLDERLKDEHKKIIYILFFEEFLHNTKLLLKSVLLGRELEELYIPIKYSYSILREVFKSQQYRDIENPLAQIMGYLRELIDAPGEKDSRGLELVLEVFYTESLLNTAESLGRKMMIDYMRYKIDLLNIEAIYRNKHLGGKGSFAGFLHKGGSLELEMLAGLEKESMDYVVKQLENTDYADVAVRGSQWLFSDSSFSSFERNRDLYFLDYFDTIKYSVSNLEKIFQFFLKKKIELININILYTGVKFDADRASLRCKVD